MKNHILKLALSLFLYLGIAHVANAQWQQCSPCNGAPCMVLTFNNNSNCDLDYYWIYPGTSCGPVLAAHLPAGTTGVVATGQCMKCGDLGICNCPTGVEIVDPVTSATINPWGSFSTWINPSTTTYNGLSISVVGGGSCTFNVSITVTGANSATFNIN